MLFGERVIKNLCRNQEVFPHSMAVQVVVYLALPHLPENYLTQQEMIDLVFIAPWHDVGKIGWLDEWFTAKRDHLSEADWAEMQQHPQRSGDILEGVLGIAPEAADLARGHHERPDGDGYPAEREPSRAMLLLAACDVLTACLEHRGYRKAPLSYDAAIRIISLFAPFEIVRAVKSATCGFNDEVFTDLAASIAR